MKLIWVIFLILVSCNANSQIDQYDSARKRMVEEQIMARGVTDEETLRAMRIVPRHLFVPVSSIPGAYSDGPLPIGYSQTISQPFIVAYMTALSRPAKNKKALEIGTGSGYQAAVLAEIVDTVYTIEIVPELAKESADRLHKLGYSNIITRFGDGYNGWTEHAPFDIIIVTAAADHIPQPLKDQLAENGRLVMTIGNPHAVQELVLIVKKKGVITETRLDAVRFVPLRRLK